MVPITIIKRNGSRQSYDVQKLTKALIYAGVNYEAVPDVVRGLESWLPTVATNGEVTSAAIRQKVIEILSQKFPRAAEKYQNYSKMPLNS